MTLLRHYKNKTYKRIGLARHSETLEELVIYEALYDNDLGRAWARPKSMFESAVEVDGRSQPRFQEVPIVIGITTEVGESEIARIAPLIEQAFGQWDPTWFLSTFQNHRRFLLTTATIEKRAVGFKLGYEHDRSTFYSWLGGVIPEFRGFGVATALMDAQHAWCREQGYRKILTKTQNRFRGMLLLNIRSGFEIIGTHQSHEGGMKIILEKAL